MTPAAERFRDPFLTEIASQPEAIRRAARAAADQQAALRRVQTIAAGRPVLFTGMGGSYATCYAPVTVLAGRGVPTTMVDAAELLHFRLPMLDAATVLVAVSQSGESAEVIRLVAELAERPPQKRPSIVSVTNGMDNSLARGVDVALDTRAGPEAGPSSLTYAASLVLLAAISAALAPAPPDGTLDRLQAAADQAAHLVQTLVDQAPELAGRVRGWLGDRSILALLGRGTARAATEMGALTLKEAARFPAESLQSAQFRHGPLELIGPQAAVVIAAMEEATKELDLRLAKDLAQAGAAVLLISADGVPPEGVEAIAAGGHDRSLSAVPAIVPLQLLAWRLALDRGFEPGSYSLASKVTTHE